MRSQTRMNLQRNVDWHRARAEAYRRRMQTSVPAEKQQPDEGDGGEHRALTHVPEDAAVRELAEHEAIAQLHEDVVTQLEQLTATHDAARPAIRDERNADDLPSRRPVVATTAGRPRILDTRPVRQGRPYVTGR